MLYYGDMDMLFFSGLFVFSFGTIIGSFLNVLVLRLGTGEAIGRGRSRCFSCGKTLTWRELIPLVSFITQKGKCRLCGSRISWQYPIVEFITGLVFLLVALKLLHYQFAEVGLSYVGFYFFGAFAYWSAIFSILIAISVYDFRHKIIPNQLVYPFIVLGFLLGPWLTAVSVMLSFWIGTLIAVPVALLWGGGLKTQIPFGPFLALGAFISWFAGNYLLETYQGLLF